MSTEAIPHADAEFDVFQRTFVAALAANPAKYGVAPADVTQLQAQQAAWAQAFPAHLDAKGAALAAAKAKDAAKDKLEATVRACMHKMRGTPTVDDAARRAAGLPPQNAAHTAVAAPATRPVARVEATGHQALTLHFSDAATPDKRAKPHGVHGCQVWSHVGEPAPADPSGYAFLALDTRTPYLDQHPAADAGKSVYYLLRWESTKGEPGPWSDVISAKIPV